MGDLTMDFLRLMLMAAMLLTSLQGQAGDAASEPAAMPATHEVEFLRSPDKACTDCHKEQASGMHGKHGQATNPNNLAPVTCTNCHGQPSPQHREGVKDVMRFSDSFNPPQGKEAYPHRRAERGMHELPRTQAIARGALGPRRTRHQAHLHQLPCAAPGQGAHGGHTGKVPYQALRRLPQQAA